MIIMIRLRMFVTSITAEGEDEADDDFVSVSILVRTKEMEVNEYPGDHDYIYIRLAYTRQYTQGIDRYHVQNNSIFC